MSLLSRTGTSTTKQVAARVGENGEVHLSDVYAVTFWGDENVLKIDGGVLAHTVNVPNATEFFTLSGLFM